MTHLPPASLSCPSNGRPGSTSAAFSLIELLVVVAVMGILLAMGASVFSSSKGAEVTKAGGVLTDLAHLARQNALSKNTRTMLVIGQVTEAGQPRSAASIWDAATTNQLERWNLLPVSVVAENSGVPQDEFAGRAELKFRGAQVDDPQIYWFYPDGRMGDNLTNAPKLKVEPRQGEANNFYELIFNPVTGTAKVNRP